MFIGLKRARSSRVAFVVVVISAAAVASPLRYDLSDDWLDGTAELTVARFARLVSLADEDSEAQALLARAAARAGLAGSAELIQIVSVCGEDAQGAGFSGPTGETTERLIYPSLEALAHADPADQVYGKRIRAFLAELGAVGYRVDVRPDYARVRAWTAPSVCILAGITLGQAYETFVHELTHVVAIDPAVEVDVLGFRDEAEYVTRTVHRAGEEIDAYIAGFRASIRLTGTRASIPQPMRPLFSPAGDFVGSRERLAELILAPSPDGFGYAGETRFRSRAMFPNTGSEYLDRLTRARSVESELRDGIAKLAEHRLGQAQLMRTKADEAGRKVSVHSGRLGRARLMHDTEMVAIITGEIEAARREAERYEKLAQAARTSHERVSADLQARDERLRRYGAKR